MAAGYKKKPRWNIGRKHGYFFGRNKMKRILKENTRLAQKNKWRINGTLFK